MTNAFTAFGLFGSLFLDAEIASEFSSASFTKQMLAFESAWTKALGECGVVSKDDAETAIAAIEQYTPADLAVESGRDGLPVPALVNALRAGLPDGAARAIHTGATSQDVIDTAMVLTSLSVMDILEERLSAELNEIDGALKRFGDKPLMARTRMQAALPAKVSLRLDARRRPLSDHFEHAKQVRSRLRAVQIGGPIGDRGNPNAFVDNCAQIVADELDLQLTPV